VTPEGDGTRADPSRSGPDADAESIPSRPDRFVRRNRVHEPRAALIGALAGVAAAFSGAQPTGGPVIDAIVLFLAVGVVTWAAASAPWWAVAGIAGLSFMVALSPVWAAVGAAAFLAGLYVGVKRRDLAEQRAVVAGVALNVLLHSQLDGFLGLSAIVGVAAAVALFVVSIRRRPRAIRRRAWLASGIVVALAVLSLLGAALGANTARAGLSDGNRLARQAISTLNTGDYQLAAEQFAAAERALERADRQLSRPWSWGALLVPVVAQNYRAATDLSSTAASAAGDVAVSLDEVDPDALRLTDGAIDTEAVRAISAPLERVDDALSDLRRVISDNDSQWIAEPIERRLVDLEADLDENAGRLDTARSAVALAPGLLGADGPRTYLVLFTTPAEGRGITGFPGNFAELQVDDGAISMPRFGRVRELQLAVAANGATCEACPDEFLTRYGRFGFNLGPDGGITVGSWSNITMPAHFPYVAEAASVLYPQSGGRPIDGVVVMDPFVIQALLAYTGPIEVPEVGVTLDETNAARFIIFDQYAIADRDERIDVLDFIGRSVVDELLTGTLPDPPTVARDLGPFAEEHRLMFWSTRADEVALLQEVGLVGDLPLLSPGAAGFGFTTVNATGSKLEVYLDDEVSVRLEPSAGGGSELVAEVVLTNNAPTGGVPQVLITNGVGLPLGTNRLFVSFYGPDGLVSASRDGEAIDLAVGAEAGWTTYATFADIAPGGSTSFELRFATDVTDEAAVITWRPPTVRR
jgi:hypothetical protein